jgi:uncharacterized protein YraI
MKYAVDTASGDITYIPSFMKIGSGVRVMVKLCLVDLKGCNVGITEGRIHEASR